ncbi:hypothetical protein NDU88_004907 [Pleurodeles waltl]|uniref:Uncharacterized protein n=1 Tax=Pleurodeles waltl TaxID=8319 RepID=A0AAV7W823_PLEWA|nr:hypothetical protein NDU88_004907 [Pleurodeles waltl]
MTLGIKLAVCVVGEVLEWLERRDKGSNWVLEILVHEGTLQTTGTAMAKTLGVYYEALYASSSVMTSEDCNNFIKDLTLLMLTAEDRMVLDQDLTVEEITSAVRALQFREAAGRMACQ